MTNDSKQKVKYQFEFIGDFVRVYERVLGATGKYRNSGRSTLVNRWTKVDSIPAILDNEDEQLKRLREAGL